jgi:heme-degrading monooxygenase HmoA
MVARIWHGRTPLSKADEYKQYLFDVGVKKIATLPGNRGVQLMMNRTVEQAEFMVVSYWDSLTLSKATPATTTLASMTCRVTRNF